ncbi:MAG: TPM domain-containing protein [Bacteroidia bacterium]|nr:TPM domain-containing protein [Bacteroidia bacterium]
MTKYLSEKIKPSINRCLALLIFLAGSLVGFAAFSQTDGIPEKPNPPKLINDFANLLQENQANQLENKVFNFNKESSTQITVVTVADLKDNEPADFAFKLGEKWGVGEKEKNNGVVLLISLQPKKIFIATGYGTEEFLPDAVCFKITENIIKPEFKEGNYYKGINDGVDAIISALQGKFTASNANNHNGSKGVTALIIVFIILIILFKIAAKNNNGPKNGGNFGGGIWGGGGWTNISSGRSSWGGSSSGSSGFGGFGGGSFGGGGAGSSW